MVKSATDIILQHADHQEIISKLLLGISPKDIHDNLVVRYGDLDKKMVIAESTILSFKKNSLNIYKTIQADLAKTSTALATNSQDELNLTLQNNPTYKETLTKLANNELDIKTMLANLIMATQTRIAQIFDQIQEDPRNINTKTERLFNEYIDRLQAAIEKWQKYIVQTPDQVIQHNISVQHIDNQVTVFYNALRKVLAQMDIETSLYFMEVFNEELTKLNPNDAKILPVEERLAEVKLLNDEINQKINSH